MTQKELLYVEDAIKHEKNIIDILCFMSENCKNESTCTFGEKEIKKHEIILEKLNNLLEDKANE